ncbi:MAG TPA: PfkB family carbohydrate kinase [Streptosporangiaceae bacterium]|nr:PfkB family carbohydrate kinase [Streptosporangiaceae bacterium]
MITVVGESLVDVVARQGHGELTVHPGGSPANVAVALSRLGQRTALVTQIGADDHGALIRTHLERNGVGVILAGPPGRPTSRALARLDARGAASYEFELSWDVRGLRLAEGSAAVHIGSLGVMLAPGGEQVLRLAESACRGGGVVVSYDPNARPSVTPDRREVAAIADRAAASAHIVKMSDEDLAFLFPGVTPAQLAARLLAGGRPTQLLVITMGRDGATVVTRSSRFAVPAVPVVVVDTVGAGDTFTAALLAGLAEAGQLSPEALAGRVAGEPGLLRDVVGQALAAAALTCTRPGADPPTAGQLKRFLAAAGTTGTGGRGRDQA